MLDEFLSILVLDGNAGFCGIDLLGRILAAKKE
jgi:hypothetical protein